MEQKLLTIFIGSAVTLGFLSFVSGYLPAKIESSQTIAIPKPIIDPVSLSEVLNQIPESEFLEPQLPAPQLATPGIPPSPYPLPSVDKAQDRQGERERATAPFKPYTPLARELALKNSAWHLIEQSLQPMVDFWINVYANYDLHHTIFHDSGNLEVVYGVLDFEDLWKNEQLTEKEKRAIRADMEEEQKERLKKKFPAAAENIRGQWGQKSKFESGLIRSGRYMPEIRSIFEKEGVPGDVAHLVFVESMFTLGAVSKVGAGGPWQFMPKTARMQGLTMNAYIDERRDPILAARAAAKLLRKNHELLGTWPLAINAYNSGPLRMLKAVKRLGTKKIDVIIRHFEDRGYQFASRNFYPEFLAAYVVAVGHHRYFGEIELDTPIAFERITLPWSASLYDLAQITATDVGILKEMNPAYHDRFFERGFAVPQGYAIRIPSRQKEIFLAALNETRRLSKISGGPEELVLEDGR